MITVYLLLFAFLSLLSFSKVRCIDNRFFFLLCLTLILFALFRSETMRDYLGYYYFFQGGENPKFEFGFRSIVRYFNHFTYNPLFFFGLFASLSVGLKLFFLAKHSQFWVISVVVYLSNIYILHDMIQLRAAIASALLLWSLKYVYERRCLYFVIIVFVAFLFHYSSLLILPLYLLNRDKISKWMFLLIPISYVFYWSGIKCGTLVQYVPFDFVQNLYELYTRSVINNDETVNIYNILHLLRCIICFLLLYNVNLIIKRSKYIVILLKIYILSLASLVLFSDIPTLAFRISELYQVVEIILIPMLIYIFKKELIGFFLVLLFAILMLYINVFHTKLLG